MRTLIALFISLFPLITQGQRSDSQREKEVRAYLDSAIASKDQVEIAEAWYRLAKVERRKMNILESNKNLFRAIRILEKSGPSYELGRCYYWLALNANEMQDDDEELKYLEKSLNIHEAAGSHWGRMVVYNTLASRYAQILNYLYSGRKYPPDYEKALHYIDLSLFYAAKAKASPQVVKELESGRKSVIDLKNGRPNSHFVESNPERVKNNPGDIDVLSHKLDYASYLAKNKRLKESLGYIKEAEEIINRLYNDNPSLLRLLSRSWADYYLQTQNYPEVIRYLEKYYEYNSKVLVEDREGAVSRLHILFETEKKEAELTRQALELRVKEQNITFTQRLLWLSLAFLLIASGLSFFLYRLNQKNKAISLKNTLLLQEQNHRVKNNLQVVSSLLNLQANMLTDPNTRQAIEETQLRISAMVQLHRQLYENGHVAHIDMERFIPDLVDNVLESYDLQQVRLTTEASGQFLPADTATLLGLLINELVTNACKYAFREHPDPRLIIRLAPSIKSNTLIMSVKDNGLKEPELNKGPSFGSRLIGMMAAQLDGSCEYIYNNGLEFQLTFETS